MRQKRKYTRRVPVAPTVQFRMVPLHYFHEEGMDRYRVWREDWAGDCFEVMTPEQFRQTQYVCIRFSIPLTEQVNED